MPHTRNRHLLHQNKQSASFWPVIGVIGPRQSGKSTLLRDLSNLGTYVTFDDEDTFDDAAASPKNFLKKLPTPLIIDEAQKVPKIFDAVKLLVDKSRRPGSYILSGSSQFSARIGIRESLTGRIGIHFMYPMTLAEAHQKSFDGERCHPSFKGKARFQVEQLMTTFHSGMMPVPLFTRDTAKVDQYFDNWLETTVLRDTLKVFGRSFDPDVAYSILRQIASASKDGEYASLIHFKQDSRKVRRYLEAFAEIFLIRRIPPHEFAVGSDIWNFFDNGVLSRLCGGVIGESLQLSLARTAIFNEILARCEYSQKRVRPIYYKTARGAPVDLIWHDCLIKISNCRVTSAEYDLRPLRAAMKKLRLKHGFMLWGRDQYELEKLPDGSTITIAPWTHFS